MLYKTTSMTARGTQRNPVSKNKMKQNEIIPWPWVDHITFVSSEECRTNCSGCSSEYLLFTAQSPAPNNNKHHHSIGFSCMWGHTPQSQHLETEAERFPGVQDEHGQPTQRFQAGLGQRMRCCLDQNKPESQAYDPARSVLMILLCFWLQTLSYPVCP